MNKPFLLFIIISILLIFGCQEEKNTEEKNTKECENFKLLGSFNQGEKVSIKFNSKVIHEDFFEDRSWTVSQMFCVEYTDTFRVDFRILQDEKVVLDTSMVGYSKKGNYLLVLPKGRPKGDLLEKVRADIDYYETIPPDSLVRTAELEPGLIVSD